MKTPHKHAEVIKAWADGALVQYFDPEDGWKDCEKHPIWSVNVDYRIKPEPRKGWYRVALMKDRFGGLFTCTADNEPSKHVGMTEEEIRALPSFLKWLTPLTEYEVD